MNHSLLPESKLPRIIPNFPPSSLILTEIPGKVKGGNSVLVCEKYSLPHSERFSTRGKTPPPCVKQRALWLNRQGQEFLLFLGRRAACRCGARAYAAGGGHRLFTTHDDPRHVVTEGLELCSTQQGNRAGQSPLSPFQASTHRGSPGRSFSASVLTAPETLSGVFDSALT